MITFKDCSDDISEYCFIIPKTINLENLKQKEGNFSKDFTFGLVLIKIKDEYVIRVYDNSFKFKEELLKKETYIKKYFKIVRPYYKDSINNLHGEVWKDSYRSLINVIIEHDPIEVDAVSFKKRANINDNVTITDAKYVYRNLLNTIHGIIIDCVYSLDKYTIKVNNGTVISLHRAQFEIKEQDQYVLVHVKCKYCNR